MHKVRTSGNGCKFLETSANSENVCWETGAFICPISVQMEKLMASTGIEPATFALLARRSNQLS